MVDNTFEYRQLARVEQWLDDIPVRAVPADKEDFTAGGRSIHNHCKIDALNRRRRFLTLLQRGHPRSSGDEERDCGAGGWYGRRSRCGSRGRSWRRRASRGRERAMPLPLLLFTRRDTLVRLGVYGISVQGKYWSITVQVVQSHIGPAEIVIAINGNAEREKAPLPRLPVAGVVAGTIAVINIVEVSG